MNGITRTPRQVWALRLLGVSLTLVGALFTDYGKTEASPIYRTWSQYLLGGPSVWEKVPHPPVTKAIEAEIWRDIRSDPGGSDLMVQFLLWKQSLDPPRFAHYHPNLAPALNKLKTPTTGSQQVGNPPPSDGGGGPSTHTPEPSSLLLALTLTGWGLWSRRRTDGVVRG
jgi:hypothetical protein